MKWAGIFLLAAMLAGCRHETVGEVIRGLRGDAYVKSIERGHHRLEIRFVPESLYYLTYSSLDTNRPFSRELLDSLKTKGYLGYGLMFTLTLGPRRDSLPPLDYRNDVVFGQISGEENYRAILERFRIGLPDRIWIEIDGKRMDLRTHQMTNSWGMSKSRTFTLLFDPPWEILPGKKGTVCLVIDNLVPGQARDKIRWDLPLNRVDFI